MTAITVSLVVMIGLAAFHHLSLTSLVRTRPDWAKRSKVASSKNKKLGAT